ncbi:sugar ABC transporter substrate-binding protein [Clostridium estertheticum]|uniref:sugar ABC transporter substrate-binding protein n=1 Tax=Clostridium estertheticum TaxID=238834 RepID=UPI001C7D6008|nr:sugar ABC transporter substrate-binding protein [Clostridium estertheticum]MBX4263177.1 sugar ABC transporter substrate-binding protein [Clostridium estertheticum]WLC89482.1 sugar ABC transporter substrate-binding protein [Clostridium estertheticum]
MKKKKVFLWCMMAMLTLSTVPLSGCGSSTASTSSNKESSGTNLVNVKNPITITAFIGDSATIAPTPDNKIFKKIKDELGITFKTEILAGDINQKLGVMIAGGDLPDLVTYSPKFQDAGDLIPLESKIPKSAPDIYKHIVSGNAWGMIKDAQDGHSYYMPNYGVISTETTGAAYNGPAFWIQKDVLKEANYPKVTTLDQYFDLIQAYVKKHPTSDGKQTIGFESLATNAQSFVLENAPAQLSGHPNDGMVNVDKGVASLYTDKDISKTYYKKLNDMYNLGILDREAITQTKDQYLQKVASGRVVGMYDQHWDFLSGEATLTKEKKDGQTYTPLAITYDGVKPHYKDVTIPNLLNGFSITKNCKEPDRVLAALNLLMTEKWQKILNWGIEGEDYSIDPATKQPVWTDQQKANFYDNAWKAKNRADAILGTLPKIEGKYSDGNATALGDNSVQYAKGLTAYDKTFLKAYKVNSPFELMGVAPKNDIYYPCWNINIPANSPASLASTAINNSQLKWLPRVVASTGSDFDKQWSSYKEEINRDNPKAYLDAINEGIQYRIKNWTVKK